MSKSWQPSIASCHVWYWHHATLSNGWTAQVCDDSGAVAPTPSTRYTASAVNRCRIVTHPKYIDSFEEGKKLALELALNQSECGCCVCRAVQKEQG